MSPRRLLPRGALAWAAFLAVAACSSTQEPTQVVLVVDSDLPVPAGLSQVEIAAQLAGVERFRKTYDVGTGERLAKLPIVLGFVSPDHRADTIRIEVTGHRLPTAPRVVVRSATLQFLPHRVLRLDLPLLARCEGVTCEPGSTCYVDGRCTPESVDSNTLGAFVRKNYPNVSMYTPAAGDGGPDAPAADAALDAAVDAADAMSPDAPLPSCAETCTAGRCYGEVCCRGCWDGVQCREGQALTFCGAGGAACSTCEDGNPCTDDSCVAGGCMRVTASGSCPTGTCVEGMCRCGAAGQPCCKTGSACVSGLACTGQGGTCGACGSVGQPCCAGSTCATGVCSGVNCVACGAKDQACCAGSTCNAGLACAAGKCACGGAGQPCCPTNACLAGLVCSGNACAACGAKDQPCCAGNACGASLACSGGACRCGGKGEPCCGGTTCGAGLACNGSKVCGCPAGVPECAGVCRPGLACCPGSVGGRCGQCGTDKCNTAGQWECQDQHGNCNSPGSVICIGGSAGCPCGPGTRQECDQSCNMSGCF